MMNTKLSELPKESVEFSDAHDCLLLNEIFRHIKLEVKRELERQKLKENQQLNIKELENEHERKILNGEFGKELAFLQTEGNDKRNNVFETLTERRWNIINIIKEYTDFIKEKMEQFKELSKEYVIEYINKNEIKRFHHDEMENILKRFSKILLSEEKCFLCGNYIFFPVLFLKHLKEKKEQKTANLFSNSSCALKNSTYSCNCFEGIEKLPKLTIIPEEKCRYVDVIKFFESNKSLYAIIKNRSCLRTFHKYARLMNICKGAFSSAANIIHERKKERKILNTKKVIGRKNGQLSIRIKKPEFTLKDVQLLNSDVDEILPLLKMYNIESTINRDEKAILHQCLKTVGRIKILRPLDVDTLLVFTYLCNLQNVVLRLKIESFFCCYSEKRFHFFLDNILHQIKHPENIGPIYVVSENCLDKFLKSN